MPQRLQVPRTKRQRAQAPSSRHIGYLARLVVQAGLPHRDPNANTFRRRNGHFSYWMTGHPDLGLPYGRYPRLLLVWATTQAVRTRSPVLYPGPSLSRFMSDLGLLSTGGRWGTNARLREQMKRLFGSTIGSTLDRDQHGEWHDEGFRVTRTTKLWWEPSNSLSTSSTRDSVVVLSPGFFESVTYRPVPVDLATIASLRAPFTLDLYAWLTYRMSYLRRPTLVSWRDLEEQFGANYSRTRDFRLALIRHAHTVLAHYPDAQLRVRPDGLLLRPSAAHVRRSAR